MGGGFNIRGLEVRAYEPSTKYPSIGFRVQEWRYIGLGGFSIRGLEVRAYGPKHPGIGFRVQEWRYLGIEVYTVGCNFGSMFRVWVRGLGV